MSYNITMPTTFTVSADIFNAQTGEEATDDVRLVLDGAQWRFDIGDGHEWTIATHEVEEMYKAHMCAKIGTCGVLTADDPARAAHKGIFVLHFGAYGCTHVLAFGTLGDALEDAASVLPPGMFYEPDMEAAREDMYGEGSLSEEQYNDRDCDEVDALVHEYATTDLTYTQSGYLLSWEWTCTEFSSLQAALEWAQSVAK